MGPTKSTTSPDNGAIKIVQLSLALINSARLNHANNRKPWGLNKKKQKQRW
jgi:hypothetical protein